VPAQEVAKQKAHAKPCCSYLCASFFLLVGFLGVLIYMLFTPVYKPVTCNVSAGMLDAISVPGQSPSDQIPFLPSIPFVEPASKPGVTIHISLTCHNPNPISVSVHEALGTVYIGAEKAKVGTIEVQDSVLPAYSNGTMPTKDSVVLDPALVQKDMLRQALLGGVPMQFELAATATISLFGASGTPTIQIRCGMMMASATSKILDPHGPMMGPMSCSTADDLTILPIYAQKEETFKKYMALAETVKNVVAISCMFLGFVLGSFFIYRGIRSQGCCRRCHQVQDVTSSRTEKTPARTSEPEEFV